MHFLCDHWGSCRHQNQFLQCIYTTVHSSLISLLLFAIVVGIFYLKIWFPLITLNLTWAIGNGKLIQTIHAEPYIVKLHYRYVHYYYHYHYSRSRKQDREKTVNSNINTQYSGSYSYVHNWNPDWSMKLATQRRFFFFFKLKQVLYNFKNMPKVSEF